MNPSAFFAMLTKEVLFGMNALTLAGFVLMAFGLNLSRSRRISLPAAFALMGLGTILVFAGIYTLQRAG